MVVFGKSMTERVLRVVIFLDDEENVDRDFSVSVGKKLRVINIACRERSFVHNSLLGFSLKYVKSGENGLHKVVDLDCWVSLGNQKA